MPNVAYAARTRVVVPTSDRRWHVVVNGVRIGPIRGDELETKMRMGGAHADSLCWSDGFPSWQRIGEVRELAGLLQAPAPRPRLVTPIARRPEDDPRFGAVERAASVAPVTHCKPAWTGCAAVIIDPARLCDSCRAQVGLPRLSAGPAVPPPAVAPVAFAPAQIAPLASPEHIGPTSLSVGFSSAPAVPALPPLAHASSLAEAYGVPGVPREGVRSTPTSESGKRSLTPLRVTLGGAFVALLVIGFLFGAERGIIPIAGGLIAASGFILSRRPNAKELIDRLTPYQGGIGVVMFLWGFWECTFVVRSLALIAQAPLAFAFMAAVSVGDLLVGFLLGFGLISKYALNRNDVARVKGQALRAKLVRIQAPLGLFVIATGVTYLIWFFSQRSA